MSNGNKSTHNKSTHDKRYGFAENTFCFFRELCVREPLAALCYVLAVASGVLLPYLGAGLPKLVLAGLETVGHCLCLPDGFLSWRQPWPLWAAFRQERMFMQTPNTCNSGSLYPAYYEKEAVCGL